MPHTSHNVTDTDKFFSIDPKTREITFLGEHKLKLIQEDHNSERVTFAVPRHIDGHDMLTCTNVEVHYNNISASTKEESPDVYPVDDVRVSPDSDDVVIFSWLISGNATKHAGILAILISFKCTTGDKIDYAWHTDIYSDITIGSGMNNGEASIREYTDVLARWKAEIDRLAPCALVGLEQTQTSTESGGVNVLTATFGDGRKETFEVRNGKAGEDGKDGTNCFVRYSHYPDGTDFSKTFGEHEYIGFATGLTAPTDKRDYTWSKFRNTTVNTNTSVVFDTVDDMNAWIESKTEKVAEQGVYEGLALQEGCTIIYSVDDIPDTDEEIEGAGLLANLGLNDQIIYDSNQTVDVFIRNGRYFFYYVVPELTIIESFSGSIEDYNGYANRPYSTNSRWAYSSQTLDKDTIPDELLEFKEKVVGFDIELGTNFYVGGEEEFRRYVWDGNKARLIETAQATDLPNLATKEEVKTAQEKAESAIIKAERAESIAKGANQAIVYDTEAEMLNSLPANVYEGLELPAGSTVVISCESSQELSCEFTINDMRMVMEEYEHTRGARKYWVCNITEPIVVESFRAYFYSADAANYDNARIAWANESFDYNSVPDKLLEPVDIKVGTNLYIRELNVPDYWWDGSQPQQLETQKVSLTPIEDGLRMILDALNEIIEGGAS